MSPPPRRKLPLRSKASGTGTINLKNTQVNSSPTHEDLPGPTAPAPTATHEIAMLKMKLEAEKEKANLREETISILKADKAYLQDELAKKDALICSAFPKMKPTKKQDYPKPCTSTAFPLSTSEETAPEDPSSSLSDSSAENVKLKGKHRPKKKCQKKSSEAVHTRVRMRNTKGIVLRYVAALEAFKKGQSMKAAFAAIGVDRNTISRTAVIAEIHLAAPDVFDTLQWNERTETLSAFIQRCRATLSPELLQKINQMKMDRELLPIAQH